MIADSHVEKSRQVVEAKLKDNNVRRKKTNKIADHPFSRQSYCPDLDMIEDCNDDKLKFYQILVGKTRWLCEIERMDILTETLPIGATCW